MKLLCALTFAAGLLGAHSVCAAVASSANFSLQSAVLNNGGGQTASASLRLNGSLGEPALGIASSANFILGGVPAVGSLIAVFSRKAHGVAGSFDIPIDFNTAIGGAVSVEPRAAGPGGHEIYFQFNAPVTFEGYVTLSDSNNNPLGPANRTASGNFVIVTPNSGVDNKRVRIALSNVNGSTSAEASVAFLRGDVDFSRAVSSVDITGVKARAGQAVTPANFRYDINTTGAIGAADIAAVKARSGTILP